ncbi:hypothetical protein OAI25_04935, partial [Alphaproteobacteria bacterium]|nr:hypothetical protein [Alphaproteobacteria bacterium]
IRAQGRLPISDFSNLIARSCVALLGWCYQFKKVRVNIVLEKKRCAFVQITISSEMSSADGLCRGDARSCAKLIRLKSVQ